MDSEVLGTQLQHNPKPGYRTAFPSYIEIWAKTTAYLASLLNGLLL
jgi:hypothetical protein